MIYSVGAKTEVAVLVLVDNNTFWRLFETENVNKISTTLGRHFFASRLFEIDT